MRSKATLIWVTGVLTLAACTSDNDVPNVQGPDLRFTTVPMEDEPTEDSGDSTGDSGDSTGDSGDSTGDSGDSTGDEDSSVQTDHFIVTAITQGNNSCSSETAYGSKFVNFGTDSVRVEFTEKDISNCQYQSGGFVQIWGYVNDIKKHLDTAEADFKDVEVYEIPEGAYARVRAFEDLDTGCTFDYWKLETTDEAIYDSDVIYHHYGDENSFYIAFFDCGSSETKF